MTASNGSNLFNLAATQGGHFTTSQPAEAGYSRPLLDNHLKAGRFLRVLRGIYRLRDFPSTDHEDLVRACSRTFGGVVPSDARAALPGRHHPRRRRPQSLTPASLRLCVFA